jgi:TolB-like protein/class 3 adenylate cyclase/rhodanese-related sulfurtransferase
MAEVNRKLAAILSADVAGYSRLMADDEAATVRTLTDYREVFKNHIARHKGRVIDTAGDSVLAEFASPVEAVECAADIQRELLRRNRQLAEHRRMHFRIGVNLGDVITRDDGTIYGDGVNVAARLEGLAEPGGVMISQSAHMQVRGKLDLGFADAGEQEVKNLPDPVRAYRVDTDASAAMAMPKAVGKGKTGLVAAAAAVVVVIALVGLAIWRYGAIGWLPSTTGPEEAKTALTLPDKPSIAVLPFANLSDDPEQEYFADGLTEDLITDLSRIQDLFVIARNSSFTYKGKPTKVQNVAADLGVQYVLEGSVRRTGDAVRINAQLIDALTGRHLWAERYEGAFAGIFELQDQVLGQIIANLAIVLTDAESPIAGEAETDVVEAYDTFLQGWDHYRRRTPDDNLVAIALFEKAIELDPDYSRAYAALAAAYWDRVNLNFELTHGLAWERAYEKAVAYLDKAREAPTSDSYRLSAEMLALRGRHDEAGIEIDRAIALDPNSSKAHISKALILNVIGRAAEAEQSARAAMRLDPHYQPDYLRVLSLALFHQGRYAEAAELLERVLSQQPDHVPRDYVTLASAYGHLGRLEEADAARTTYDEMMAEVDYTPLTVQEMGFYWYSDMFDYHSDYTQSLQDGLRKAGVPEGPGEPHRYAEYKALITRDDNGLYSVEGATKINAARAKALHQRGDVTFVDVRAAGVGMFASGHIPGAVNLDLNMDLSEQNLSQLVGKSDEVVFNCVGNHCPYSTYASAKAITWGYTRVYYFAGGVPAWEAAGYPIETSSVVH